MQCSPVQLKDKLLKALDKQQNVVDLPSVLEVISALETYSISRESLEQTRIGKFVNDMRRKTKNKDLARRAKNLVRKWKELVESQQSLPDATVNGGEVAGNGSISKGPSAGYDHLRGLAALKPESPASWPGTPSSGRSVVSPGLAGKVGAPGSRPNTPLNHLSRVSSPRLSRPATPSNAEETSGVNCLDAASTNVSTSATQQKGTSESLSRANIANKRKRTDDEIIKEMPNKKSCYRLSDNCSDIYGKNVVSKNKLHASNSEPVMNGAIPHLISHKVGNSSIVNNANCDKSKVKNSLMDQQSKVTQSNKQCVQQRSSPPEFLLKKNATVPGYLQNTDQTDKCLPKTPKVKTTAELIKDMSVSRGLRVAGSQTATKIVLNQITKEKDDINSPVVPPEAKPRFRRKPGTPVLPTSPRQSLTQTKNDMINKFLQSSSNEQQELPPFVFPDDPDDIGMSRPIDSDTFGVGNGRSELDRTNKVTFFVGDEEAKPADQVEKATADGASKEVDPWSLLPPLNLADIDWTSDDYPEVQQSTNYDLDQLEKDHISGLNGQHDHNNDWCDWTQTHSMPSYDGDLIHILPYVNIDF